MKAKHNVYLAYLSALVLILSACGGPGAADRPVPVVDQSQKPKVLSGTVEGWAGEDAVVRAETYNAEDEYVVLAQSEVAADGSFSLSLPGAEGVADILFTLTEQDFLCETDQGTATGTFEMTPSSLEVTAVELTVYSSSLPDSNNEDYLGFFHLGNAEQTVEVVQFYVKENASLRGSCTLIERRGDPETGEKVEFTDTLTVNLNLVSGWNNVIFTTSETRNSATTGVSTSTIPEGLAWRYYPLSACELGDCEGGL